MENADIQELRRRINEAKEQVKKTTYLMLRAVWQYITQHRAHAGAVSGSPAPVSGSLNQPRAVASQLHSSRNHPKMGHDRKGKTGTIDQARLSRDLYRTVFQAARHQVEEKEHGKGTEQGVDKVGDSAVPSVALLLLQSSRDRAIMSLFMLRLRLAVCWRRHLNAECEMRYFYYRQRRIIRAWHHYTQKASCRRRQLVCAVLTHWVGIVERRHRMRKFMDRFRVGLAVRRQALRTIEQRNLGRCFFHWRRRLDVRRIVCGMEARAVEMQRRHNYIVLGPFAERVGVFAARNRVFSHWKRKTERRLDARLAELIYKKSLLRRAWTGLVKRCLSVRHQRALLLSPLCDPIIVHVKPHLGELVVFKGQCAQQVANGTLRKTAFTRWRLRFRCRLSDRFFLFQHRVRVLAKWLQALRRKRMAFFLLVACWWRWRERFRCRFQCFQARHYRRRCLLEHSLLFWRNALRSRLFRRHQTLRTCWNKWGERAKILRTRRLLNIGTKRRVLLAWCEVTSREKQQHTMLCLGETLRELVLLVGCFRRWRERYEHACRVRLSVAILSDLRCEKLRARLFQRWKRLTFWSRAYIKQTN